MVGGRLLTARLIRLLPRGIPGLGLIRLPPIGGVWQGSQGPVRAIAPPARFGWPDTKGARDAALLAVFYGCGLRRGELAGLDVDDCDPDDCSIVVRGKRNAGDRESSTNGMCCRWSVRGMWVFTTIPAARPCRRSSPTRQPPAGHSANRYRCGKGSKPSAAQHHPCSLNEAESVSLPGSVDARIRRTVWCGSGCDRPMIAQRR